MLSNHKGKKRRHDDKKYCGILDGILEQKEDIGQKGRKSE
jgi:hypothetical protein